MYKRQVLVDQSPMSIKQTNDNFSALFLKLSGNIDTIDLRDGAVDTDKIKDKAVTGDKVLDGSLTIQHLETDFVSGLDLLNNPIFTSLSTSVDGNSTLIQQNKEAITLQASKVSGNEYDISQLWIVSDGIKANVSKLDKDIGYLESDVSIMAGEVSSKVSWTDFDGETIVSEINQSPSRVKISARNIELDGITQVNGDLLVGDWDQRDVEIKLGGGPTIRGSSGGSGAELKFSGTEIYFDANSISGVVASRRSSDQIELDVWSSGLAVYRDGSHIGTVDFN